jgi:cell division protein FtsI/penicillin-binding protein 2
MRTVNPPAKRGEIMDRNGRVLAYSVDADTLAADPSEIDDPDGVARQICAVLVGCNAERRADMAKKLRRRGAFVYLARQMSPDDSRSIRDLQLPGLTFLKESRRYYPKRELGAHVLGYVGLDNVGLGGIESAYDSQIRRPTPDGTRCRAASSVRRRRARASSSRSIRTCSTSPSASSGLASKRTTRPAAPRSS